MLRLYSGLDCLSLVDGGAVLEGEQLENVGKALIVAGKRRK